MLLNVRYSKETSFHMISNKFVALKRAFFIIICFSSHFGSLSTCDFSFRAGVFGDGLGPFTDGVLRQFTGQQQPDGRLDLPGGDRGAFVVMCQTGSFGGDTFEDVVHERIHDRHGLARYPGVGVHLFQHLIDVDGVALLPLVLLLFLVRLGDILLSLAGLFGGLSACLRWHFADETRVQSTRINEHEPSRDANELCSKFFKILGFVTSPATGDACRIQLYAADQSETRNCSIGIIIIILFVNLFIQYKNRDNEYSK